MKPLILSIGLLTLVTLSGCSTLVYRRDMQQGNVLTEKRVQKLRKGMSKNQVIQLLGTPLNRSTFTEQPIHYVYFFKPRRGNTSRKIVSLTFKNNSLISYTIKPQVLN